MPGVTRTSVVMPVMLLVSTCDAPAAATALRNWSSLSCPPSGRNL